ncbi:MAG: hypothetical protein ACREUY_03795, partial [Burkholderiales bacterium]
GRDGVRGKRGRVNCPVGNLRRRNGIGAASIATDAITAAKIADGAIDAATFAANAITSSVLATDCIGAAQLATDCIGSSELAAGAVTEIQSGLATASALATVQTDTDDIQARLPAALVGGRMDSSVGAMASGVLTAAAIASDAITAAKIADGAIDAATFAAGAIDAAAIATDAFGALELAAGAASEIATAVRTELTTELGRIDVATSSRMATYTQPTGFLAATFPTTVASTTNIAAASGVALSSTGLDAIVATTPTGVASTFATKLMQLWARFFGRVTKDSDEIKTYRSDGTTVATTQTYTSSGDDDDVGGAT